MLSAEELMNHRKMHSSIPHRGPKEKEPDGSTRQWQKLKLLLNQQNVLLREPKVNKRSNLALGNWSPCKELVEVKVEKGKFWQTMGYHSGSQKYLYAEEGLFLLDMNCMELRHQGVLLTLQEAYELLIPQQFTLEHYQVYSHLMRLGYITTRHKENDISDYEYRIRLHQYRHNQKKVYRKVQGWFQQMVDDAKVEGPEEGPDRYGNETGSAPMPEGQQSGNDLSGSSFTGVSSQASNEAANTADPNAAAGGSRVGSGGGSGGGGGGGGGPFPQLPGSETSSIVNNLPSDDSSVYSDSPVMVQPLKQESFGASVNLLNYHKKFLQAGESGGSGKSLPKRGYESPDSDPISEGKGRPVEPELPAAKRCKFGVDNEELIVYSDSGRDSNPKSNQGAMEPPSSGDSLAKGHRPKGGDPLSPQIKEEDFYRLLNPSDTPWNSSDLGTSQLSGTPSVNIDDVLDTFLPSLEEPAGGEPVACRFSSWNFQSIRLPNLADGSLQEASAVSKQGLSRLYRSPIRARQEEEEAEADEACLPDTNSEKAKQLMKVSQQLLQTSAKMIATSGSMMADSGKAASSLGGKAGFGPDVRRKPPTNWGEYKKLLTMGVEDESQDLLDYPAGHLWRGTVKPLVHPKDATSTGDILNQLQVISTANMTSEHTRSSTPLSPNIKLAFDVYLPSPNYKKSQPGRPKFHVVVARVSDPVPDLFTLANLLQQASAITLLVAVVDNGDITFYTLKGIELSTDISQG